WGLWFRASTRGFDLGVTIPVNGADGVSFLFKTNQAIGGKVANHCGGARTCACTTRGTIDERYNNWQTVALISDVDLAVKCNPTASRKNPTDDGLNSNATPEGFLIFYPVGAVMTGWADALKGARFKLIVFFLLAGLLVAALWPAFQSPGQPEDEGIALVYPEMFLKGRLPYRDFESNYGPGNLLILSTAYSVFG